MEKATPMAKTVISPTINKRAVNNNNGPAQATSHEVEHQPSPQDKSPAKKKKALYTQSTLESTDLFEATVADAKMEVSMLLTQFAEVLSVKATADTSKMKELEEVLREARNLECYLKEKKNHLRKTLTLISGKLQG